MCTYLSDLLHLLFITTWSIWLTFPHQVTSMSVYEYISVGSCSHLASLVRPFLMVLPLYWSRPAQCLLVAHHGYWVPCGSRVNCAGSRSRLEPQRYSVHDPSACGYALALTNPITCCLAGRYLQAKSRRRELRNQTTLSQLWVK